MSRVNHNNCAVNGCLNSRNRTKHISFFQLPKENERMIKWLKVIGRNDLLVKPGLKHKSYQVCAIHFDESDIVTTQKLVRAAIPTKYIPTKNITNEPPRKQSADGSSSPDILELKEEMFEELMSDLENVEIPMFPTPRIKQEIKYIVLDAETQTELPRLTRSPVFVYSITPKEAEQKDLKQDVEENRFETVIEYIKEEVKEESDIEPKRKRQRCST